MLLTLVFAALLFLVFLYSFPYFLHEFNFIYNRLWIRRRLAKCMKTNYCIIDRFLDVVKMQPNKPFVYFQDECFTYGEAEELSNKTARVFLQSGLKKGDVVALFSQNSAMFLWLWLGLAKIGCVGAFLNFNIRSKSLLHCFQVSGAKVLVAAKELEAAVEEVLPSLQKQQVSVLLLSDTCSSSGVESFTQKMDQASSAPLPPNMRSDLTLTSPAVYIYTSGTTGLPKAAVLSHAKMYLMSLVHITMGRTADEVLYISLPLYHSAAFIGVLGAIELGSTVAIRNKFSVSNFWPDCRKYKATAIVYIGETLRYLCNSPQSLSDRSHSIRRAYGNGTRPDVWREFLKRFGDIRVTEFYGATEGICSFINNGGKIGAVGRESLYYKWMNPYAFIKYDVERAELVRDSSGFCVEVAKGEPGLLVCKLTPRTVFSGYVGDLKQTESKRLHDVFKKGDQYFNSGDMLWVDNEGFVYFHDRVGHTFRWKGENVATTEVADSMSMTDCIQEANVYGVSVPGHEGRAGMAAIVLREGVTFDSTAVFKVVLNLLPAYARPLFIRVQESLDVTGTFKHQKRKLTEDGFNPSQISDPLYFLDLKEKDYVPLTLNVYDSVVKGTIKV
ncbi:long-chain fatty acid transport protein 2-like [Eucyclogobius newberryi]|uniref:long-chain fatty acid transport protein 2-like n=1 Tax=Eucyclogobius newberryi TaxID=166745 RepID=UPI003B595F68